MLQEDHALEDKPPSYIDLHTHSFMPDSDGVMRVQNLFPDVSGEGADLPGCFTIGIHPKNIDTEYLQRDLKIMEDVLKNNPGSVIAVGECGLDKFALEPQSVQEEVFSAQILLALRYNLPLIVHTVRSWQEIIHVKKRLAPEQTWVVHGFRSSLETAEALREAGADVLGIASIFTYGMKKGLERLEAAGLTNVSLTCFDTVCEEAAACGYISESDIARLKAFRDDPSDESWIKR